MLGIAIELGSYSVKFLTYQIDRKDIILLESDEIVTDYNSLDPSLEADKLWANQIDIITEYIGKFDEDIQIFMTLPPDIISTRFLSLPVKNKKTALAMLPFQIEEDLPFSLQDCHWAESLNVGKTNSEAVVAVVKRANFDSFFNILRAKTIKPKVLTTDVSSLAGLVTQNIDSFPESFCIIDIGHHATRSFYFYKGKLVSNHHSYVAGVTITESISKTYSISTEEATLYKHQNSFLLLEDQYEQVNDNQREFAKMMDATLQPLMHEIKRWDIGYRVTHGVRVQEVYICGGSANIKNIQNYLSSKINSSVQFFDPYKFVNDSNIEAAPKYRNRFSQVVALVLNVPTKSKMINFLKDDYVLESSTDLPLHSMAFVSTRVAILTLMLSFFFIVQGFGLNGNIDKAKKVVHQRMQDKQLNTNSKLKKAFARKKVSQNDLLKVEKLFKRKKLAIQKEVAIIKDTLKPGALTFFASVISAIESTEIEIIKFIVDEDKEINLIIKGNDEPTLKSIQTKFENDKKLGWTIELNKEDMTLILAASGGK